MKSTGKVRELTQEEQNAARSMIDAITWDLLHFLDDRLSEQNITALVQETPFFHAIVLGALTQAIAHTMPPAAQQAIKQSIPSLAQQIESQALHRRMRSQSTVVDLAGKPLETTPDPYRPCACGSGRKWRFCHGPRGAAHASGPVQPEPLRPGMGEAFPAPPVHRAEVAADEVIAHAEARGKEPQAETIAEAIEAATKGA